jgi:hypothetical protein
MPASYHIDRKVGVVFTTLTDYVTDEDLLDHQRRLLADPDFRPMMHQCIDARGVTGGTVTGGGIRTLAKANIYADGSRRAIIVSGKMAYGFARMFQILRSKGPEKIQICRRVEDAHRWLGLVE